MDHAIRLLRESCALQHLALSTEKSSAQWLVRYGAFLKRPQPKTLQTPEQRIEVFLTSLALAGVSASTHANTLTLNRSSASTSNYRR